MKAGSDCERGRGAYLTLRKESFISKRAHSLFSSFPVLGWGQIGSVAQVASVLWVFSSHTFKGQEQRP